MTASDDAHPADGVIRASTWALALLVVGAPLLIGGARLDHQLLICAVAVAVATGCAWTRIGHAIRFPWPLIGPLLLVLLGLLQLLPLPADLIATLSPRTHEILDFTLRDLGLYGEGQGHALSLDPPLTVLATIHQLAFVAVAWAAADVPRGHRSVLERALIYGPALVALLGFVHLAFGATRVYGLYVPANGAPLHGYFTSFVNNNTLASFLSLGTLVALGRTAETTDTLARGRHLTAAALCAAGVFFSASRGGQVALLVGIVTFTALAWMPGGEPGNERRAHARTLGHAALFFAALGAVLAVLLLPDWSRTAWSDLGAEGKFAAWPAAVDQAFAFPAVGTGRGTFGVTYPLFQQVTMPSTVAHPENIFLQLFCEWGAPGALIALAFGVAGWFVSVRGPGRESRPRHWGLLAGLAAVAVGQLADFGLEAAGLSLPTAAALGLALSRRPRGKGHGRFHLRWPPLATALGVLATGLIVWQGPRALAQVPDRAVDALGAASDTPAAIEDAAREEVGRHPADYFLAVRTAERLARLPETDFRHLMRWMNRALFLFPQGGDIHLLAARALARRGRLAQSADEYHDAIALAPWDRGLLVREVARRFDQPDLLARSLPADNEARRMLGNVLLGQKKARLALDTLIRLEEDTPGDLEIRKLKGGACLAAGDLACAATAASGLKAERPLQAAALEARIAVAQHDPATARSVLDAVRAVGARDKAFLTAAARIYRDLGDLTLAREALDRLWPLVALEPNQAAACLSVRGELELHLGDPRQALGAYEHAWGLVHSPQYAKGLRTAAARLGKPEAAEAVLDAAAATKATPLTPEADVPPTEAD